LFVRFEIKKQSKQYKTHSAFYIKYYQAAAKYGNEAVNALSFALT
jgi:hypothetical protein